MKIKKAFLCVFLAFALTMPLGAQSTQSTNWVDDFLRRYQPSQAPAVAPPAVTSPSNTTSLTTAGQTFRAGVVPISMQDVVNLLLDYNLEIQSNRFSPRSSYYSSLVFYRALQPSIRFTGTAS